MAAMLIVPVIGVIMAAVMVVVVVMMMTMMIMTRMVAAGREGVRMRVLVMMRTCMRQRQFRNGGGPRRLYGAQQAAALAPHQPRAERRDQAVTAISMMRSVPHMVLAVTLSSHAPMPTISTATSACASAEMNESTMPRRAVSSLATR